jgi:hypothetical protein
MVEQAAGCGNQHVNAAQQFCVLIVERHAADDQCDVELVVLAVFLEVVGNLSSKLTRRFQDERTRHARACAALFEHRKHRQHEGRGFARAGLRNAEHVAPRQYVRDSLVLNRCWGFVAGRFDSRKNFGG